MVWEVKKWGTLRTLNQSKQEQEKVSTSTWSTPCALPVATVPGALLMSLSLFVEASHRKIWRLLSDARSQIYGCLLH